jgi:butyryl-CoA dehydrogenase
MYKLTEEQRMVRTTIGEIIEDEMEKVEEAEREEKFPSDTVDTLIKQGVHLIPLPEEYGGYYSIFMDCIAIEELSKASIAVGLWLSAVSAVSRCLMMSKDEKVKEKYFKKLVDGEKGGILMTEPDAGSDVGAIKTTAILDGDEYVLNGEKCFSSIGAVADLFFLLAKVNQEKGLDGIGAFVIERKTEGVTMDRIDEKMGQAAAVTSDFILKDVRVPKENRIAGEGEGIKVGFEEMNSARLYVASMSLGAAESAFDYATAYSKERTAFGKKISEFQAVQFLLAEMAMRIETSRSLLYRAASIMDDPEEKERVPGFAAVTKCFVSEKAFEVANYAMDVLGGHGYMKDHPIERIMRDIKGLHYMEGTNYTGRLHIARAVLRGLLGIR